MNAVKELENAIAFQVNLQGEADPVRLPENMLLGNPELSINRSSLFAHQTMITTSKGGYLHERPLKDLRL